MRAIEFLLEAEQRMMEPELYEEVPNSILKKAVQLALPGVKLDFRTTPEGYLNVSNDDDSVRLDIGMSIYDSELSFNIENAYLNKHARGGVMTNIIANAFALAEKKYGIPRARSLSIEQDRSHGAWQHIADKLGLEYSAHQIGENFAKINEAFDQPYPYKWEKGEFGDYDALATLDDGTFVTTQVPLNVVVPAITTCEPGTAL